MFAQTTCGAARAMFYMTTQNAFEIRGRLHKQFALPERARATNLLSEIIAVMTISKVI